MKTEKRRFSLFPIREDEKMSWEYYQKQEENSWQVHEVNLAGDVKDWEHLSLDEREVLKPLMAFFVAAERVVVQNIRGLRNLIGEDDLVKTAFLAAQERVEVIHMHMYALFISTLIPDAKVRDKLYHGVEQYSSIAMKVNWMQQYLTGDASVSKQILLTANICAEVIYFSDAFAVAMYPKTKGVLHGWCLGNDFVLRDEFLHGNHAIDWYLEDESLTDKEFHEIIKGATEVEIQFADEILRNRNLDELTADMLKDYARYLANLVCDRCGHPRLYNVDQNPIEYMNLTALKGKTNFFERTVGEYKKLTEEQMSADLILNFKTRV